jgi:MoaA/NifB/PqqE/SkfB family radical SAM enzyme
VINQRLFDWYKINTRKDLGITNICPKPFDTVLIDQNGSCFVCECTAWLPQSVGNLHKNSLEEIFHSDMAYHLRDSIDDGSYRYCNEKQCTWIIKGDVRNYQETDPKIKTIRLAIDDSCNLSCPSCRKLVIFHKRGKMLSMRLELADRVNQYLAKHNNVTVHIGSDGDPFASLVYRHFMRMVPDNNTLKFNLQTNGLLMKKMFSRLDKILTRIDVLNISIDGASKETYELLRRGGQFEKLLENLEFIKQYHEQFRIRFHMVVQKSNWHEMSKMLQLADRFNAHEVIFNRITNWNTYDNFHEQLAPENNLLFVQEFEEIKKHPKSITWELQSRYKSS